MSATQDHHQQFRSLLGQRDWEQAQALWLDLAEQLPDQPEFLLLLVKELADVGQTDLAGDLASLLAEGLKKEGKVHEWLYALKLRAQATPKDRALRGEISEAYQQLYRDDARLKTILAAVSLDQTSTPLPAALTQMDALLALRAGSFCQHKSWGIGRVKTFDTTLSRVVIGFPHNPDHIMQLAYAAESLSPLSAEHIEVRKVSDLDNLKALASSDPLGLVRIVLLSHNHAASADRIEATLSGSVIPLSDWKKWWENVKKLIRRDSHYELPAKKTDPILLRTAPPSQQHELLDAFREAPSLGQKTAVARQLLKVVDEFSDPELLLQEFQDGLLTALRRAKQELAAPRLEAAFVIEDLRAHQRTPAEYGTSLVAELLVRVANLPETLEELSAPSQKRALAVLKISQPDRLLDVLNRVQPKVLDNIADLLPQAVDKIGQLVRNHAAGPDLLCWICRRYTETDWLQSLQGTALIRAVLASLELAPAKPAKRLRDTLLGEETLLTDLLVNVSADEVRDMARQLLKSSAFEELDRRLLMARLIKEFPFVQELVLTRTVKEQPLIVSWASYHKRQAELDDIIQKKIPQNSREIAQARSYGDLRENFEFKAAKDTQRLLMRRRAELEILLSRAQATDFAGTSTESVQVGTSVTVTDLNTKQAHTYHILGAWDGDPNRSIISYPAALAQTLLNKRAGEIVESTGEGEPVKLRIERIEKVPAEVLKSL